MEQGALGLYWSFAPPHRLRERLDCGSETTPQAPVNGANLGTILPQQPAIIHEPKTLPETSNKAIAPWSDGHEVLV